MGPDKRANRRFETPANARQMFGVLYSDFSPDQCEGRLRGSIDVERPTMFGFSGYRSSKPFLGEVDGKNFRVLQRIYGSRNSVPAVLTGEFQSGAKAGRANGRVWDYTCTSMRARAVLLSTAMSQQVSRHSTGIVGAV